MQFRVALSIVAVVTGMAAAQAPRTHLTVADISVCTNCDVVRSPPGITVPDNSVPAPSDSTTADQ